MTLLSSANAILASLGLDPQTRIIGAVDRLARRVEALAWEELEELSEYKDWRELVAESVTIAVAAQTIVPLPVDFDKIIGGSAINASDYYRLRGSLNAGDFAVSKYMNDCKKYSFRVTLAGLEFSEPLDTGDSIVFFYKSLNRVKAIGGALKTTFTADDDTPVVRESVFRKGLKWRVRQALGMDYAEDFNTYERARDLHYGQSQDSNSLPVVDTLTRTSNILDGWNIPDTGYGA